MKSMIDIEIDLINSIIRTAIDHGGDPGGPYFCFPKNLKESIENFLIFRNLNNQYEIINVDYEDELTDDEREYFKIVKRD